jgi:hypothetical protein
MAMIFDLCSLIDHMICKSALFSSVLAIFKNLSLQLARKHNELSNKLLIVKIGCDYAKCHIDKRLHLSIGFVYRFWERFSQKIKQPKWQTFVDVEFCVVATDFDNQ